MTDVAAAAHRWLVQEVDVDDAAELRALLAEGTPAAVAELADRFATTLTFGTAGLRGPLRAGPNGMNRAVVRRAAAGLATWLTAQHHGGQPVVVGYDARHRSADFARDSAAIFAAAGFDAMLLPGPLPTPVLAFAVQHLHAAAGVMVTASHNPPRDNGYKVYLADGAQLAPPHDLEIEAAIRAAPAPCDVPLADTYTRLGDEVGQAYVAAVAALVGPGSREVRIVHTALHGVGNATLRAVFAAAGFAAPLGVAQQAEPDADFPTVAFPNPEEPGALDLALELAAREAADLVIANDPDADRCAVALPGPGGRWRMLTGDQVGVLLGDALLRKGVRGTYATTIVSSSLLGEIARRYGAGYTETLTGFKWISRAAPDLVFGYEEALGYCVAPHLVRDKDGIATALLVAELAAQLRAAGSTIGQRLAQIEAEYGRHETSQVSIRVTDLKVIGALMARLRSHPPASLLGGPVAVDDLLPEADVLRWRGDGLRVVIRPSGTEPKLKAYLETSGGSDGQMPALREQVQGLLA
ncbi:MAG: phospho-sugar mutase [Jatrophihabitans sp.]|nr:MAG: phospho-sugar mutase [Jatrophihabitans sp.]